MTEQTVARAPRPDVPKDAADAANRLWHIRCAQHDLHASIAAVMDTPDIYQDGKLCETWKDLYGALQAVGSSLRGTESALGRLTEGRL